MLFHEVAHQRAFAPFSREERQATIDAAAGDDDCNEPFHQTCDAINRDMFGGPLGTSESVRQWPLATHADSFTLEALAGALAKYAVPRVSLRSAVAYSVFGRRLCGGHPSSLPPEIGAEDYAPMPREQAEQVEREVAELLSSGAQRNE